MELSRGILKEHNAPRAVAPGGDKCVNRVECGLDVRLCGRHHASDRPEKGNIRTQQTHASDFADVGGCGMVGKDALKRRNDFRSPYELTPIESDAVTVVSERGGEGIGTALVPAIQDLSIERADLDLIGR